MPLRLAIIFLLTSMLVPRLDAQELPFRHFTADNEINPLPNPAVTALFEDQDGYIWFAIYGSGLVRYDGQKMELFTPVDGVSTYVFSIDQDSLGRLWTGGSEGYRVSERPLDDYQPGEKIQFTTEMDGLRLPKTIATQRDQLFIDHRGNIWTTSSDQIIRYQYAEDGSLRADSISLALFPKDFRVVYCFSLMADSSICAISHAKYMLTLSADDLSIDSVRFDHPSRNGTPNHTQNLLLTRSGALWGSRMNGEVWRLVSADSLREVTNTNMVNGVAIRALLETREGHILAGSIGAGLVEFRPDDAGNFTTYSLKNGMISPVVWDLMQDREGNIWIATNNGLSRLPGDYKAFGHYTTNSLEGAPNMLPGPGVICIEAEMEWKPGAEPLVVAGTGDGISFIKGGIERQLFKVADGLLDNAVLDLSQDKKGRLWIAGRKGATCMSRDRRSLEMPGFEILPPISLFGETMHIANMPFSHINRVIVKSLARSQHTEERVEAIFILGARSLLIMTEGQQYFFPREICLDRRTLYGISLDPRSYLYLGSDGKGLMRSRFPLTIASLDSLPYKSGANKRFNVFREITAPSFSEMPTIAGGDTVTRISALHWLNGEMWMGTGHGILVAQGDSLIPHTQIGTKEGLKAGSAVGFQYDSLSGLLWATSNNGLAGVDVHTKKIVQTAEQKDGLVSDKAWGFPSLDITENGLIYFGTAQGLSMYHPLLDIPDTLAPSIVLRDFQLTQNDRDNNILEIEYAALSFNYEPGVEYQTRLVGFDADWADWTRDTRIRYTNLPAFGLPKTYYFEVRARDESGNVLEQSFSHSFDISPPWYLTWWAILLYLLATGVLVYLLVRWRTAEQQQKLEEKERLNERLQQVDRLKDQFLANTSHELRTPLQGIIGLSEALYEQAKSPDNKENLSMIIASGKRLSSLVNDLLDFSRVKNHDLQLQLKAIDLRSICDLVFQTCHPLIKDKALAFRNEISQDLPPVMADENRLQQILFNLVGNAIKFTEKGEISLAAVQDTEGMLTIMLTDTGIGIPLEKQTSIFQAFEQADSSIQREFSGTGLGLSISKRMVELHGGSMWVESEPDKGSTFFFSLPVSELAVEKRANPIPPKIQALREPEVDSVPVESHASVTQALHILVVDDEPINQMVIKNHLGTQAYQITQAMNGEEALKLLDGELAFDLVLLDVMMPRMSGYEVCQIIRERYLPSELPIIMVTAKNQVSDLVQGLDTGANDYLAKPFSKEEFLARVRTQLDLHHINTVTSKFVPTAFLRSLGKNRITEVALGDQTEREVTVLFCDIRDYTSMAETMTPEENFRFVNAFHSRIGPIIRQHNGFINQYLGDAIMAIFPDSPTQALQAATEMQQRLLSYNEERISHGRAPLKMGIGLHTGPLIMGIIGDEQRMDAATISDTVNTTSRLESLTKHYGTSILLSEDSLDKMAQPEQFNLRYLGQILVKGKKKPVGLYECMDGDPPGIKADKLRTAAEFEVGMQHFFDQEFAQAAAAFQRVAASDPHDPVVERFLKRFDQYAREGTPEGWTGVEVFDRK